MHFGELKAVTVQVDRMRVIRLIVEYEAIALSLLKCSRLSFFIEASPIDGPAIESSLARR